MDQHDAALGLQQGRDIAVHMVEGGQTQVTLTQYRLQATTGIGDAVVEQQIAKAVGHFRGEALDPVIAAIDAVGTLGDVEQIRNLPLRADGLRVSDVADVVYEEPPLEYGRHLDGDFAVGVTVAQEARANTVAVCDELQRVIAAMADDPELEGVNFLVWFSQGDEIRKTLRDLAFTGVFGALLATVVLFLFLRRLSTTMAAVSCIPFSLVVTCGVVWAQGHSLNTLTLLGLIVGIGMLVDNAVVVMENIFRHRELGADPATAAREGSREVAVAVTAATLTSCTAL